VLNFFVKVGYLDKYTLAENADLWAQLLDLCEQHDVAFRWVKGHAGNPDNERCDQLAVASAQEPDLPADVAYETGKTRLASVSLLGSKSPTP